MRTSGVVPVTGKPPFYDRVNRGKQGIYDDIIQNSPDFSLSQFASCSEHAVDFINVALAKAAVNRVTISQMLDHPWIKNMTAEEVDNSKQLDMSKNLAIFAKTTSFQSGICSILANMLSHSNDLSDLNKMFIQWDTSQDGYLSYEELRQNMTQITSLFQIDEPDVLKLMKAADTNGDGQVDYQEFVTAAFNKEKLINENNLRSIFKMFD